MSAGGASSPPRRPWPEEHRAELVRRVVAVGEEMSVEVRVRETTPDGYAVLEFRPLDMGGSHE